MNSTRRLRLALACVTVTTAMGVQIGAQTAQPSDRQLSWRETETSVALLNGGRVVWQWNHGTEHGKPCFHPLATLDGEELTDYRPADHRWHRAGWFSFKTINGLNYWEEDPAGVAAGTTEAVSVATELRADFSAKIDIELRYHPPGGKDVLTESRRVLVSAPDRADCHCASPNAPVVGPSPTAKDVAAIRTARPRDG